MKKSSKTQASQQLMEHMKVNSSLQDWDYNSRYLRQKQSSDSLNHCIQCGSQGRKNNFLPSQSTSNQPTKQSFYRVPLTPIQKHLVIIPDVSKSFSQHKEGSKLSLQLNQISIGFNKENKRIQQALIQIRQSTVKKQKDRYLKSMSLSKKSQTSKKSTKTKINKNVIKILNFDHSCHKKSQSSNYQHKRSIFSYENRKKDMTTIGTLQIKPIKNTLRKKNLNQLMKEQKSMLKNFNSKIRAI